MQNVKRGGRPPKVTREDIAHAAVKVGLDRATVRNIADELGVTSMTIYNHFNKVEDIVDHSVRNMIEEIIGSLSELNTFEETLSQIAKKYFDLICANCLVVYRIIEGNVFPGGTALCVNTLISYGTKRGLTPAEALFAMRSVIQAAAGCAVTSISQRGAIIPGVDGETAQRINSGEATELGYLGSALSDKGLDALDPLAGVTLVLHGLRAMFGDRMSRSVSGPPSEIPS